MTLRSLTALTLSLVIAGCGPATPPSDAPTSEPPAPEVITPDTVRADTARAEGEAVAEVREHTLTVPEVQRYSQAAEAMHRMAEEEPQLRQLQEDLEARLSRAESIEEVQQILDADPRVREALEAAGLTSRDYVLTGTALLGAYSYVLMREQGVPEPFRPEYVTDEHIRFIEQNRAEVDAVVARLQALYGTDLDDLLSETD